MKNGPTRLLTQRIGHTLVRDDLDREQWVATLVPHVCDRFAWRCLAWCLMDNHFQLVLETPKPNLAQLLGQCRIVRK